MDIDNPTISYDNQTLHLKGDWVMSSAKDLDQLLKDTLKQNKSIRSIDASQISKLDTNGVWNIKKLIKQLDSKDDANIKVVGLAKNNQSLFDQVESFTRAKDITPQLRQVNKQNLFSATGEYIVNFIKDGYAFLVFLGTAIVQGLFTQSGRKDWSLKNVLVTIESMGVAAIPIVGLLSFLIGVVLCYQMGLQLLQYNANVFIVDLSGLAILREFGPLITALIAAARTSTAFSSEIGAMKVNDEIDALTTMGVSPLARLVMPKIIGLVLALPLLTIWSDATGIFGSMVMSQHLLAINFVDFLQRFRQVVLMSSFWLGIIKAPVFALAIASVGCFQGFNVKFGADSVGKQTTKAAVQAIFLIIVIDAAFSVLYSMNGW